MGNSKGITGPGADAGRAKLQELISGGAAGAKALAATTPPGNQYVNVSNWNGQSGSGVLSSGATVVPSGNSVSLVLAVMIVTDSNQSGGGGGFFTVLDAGVGALISGSGSGSGNFTAYLLGMVVVNNQTQSFAFSQTFSG